MSVYKAQLLCLVFILMILLALPSHATNFYERHGNNS